MVEDDVRINLFEQHLQRINIKMLFSNINQIRTIKQNTRRNAEEESPKRGRGISDVPPCLEPQGCHFDLLPTVLSRFLSYPFLLLAHSPGLFPPKLPFSERYALLFGSFFPFLFGAVRS